MKRHEAIVSLVKTGECLLSAKLWFDEYMALAREYEAEMSAERAVSKALEAKVESLMERIEELEREAENSILLASMEKYADQVDKVGLTVYRDEDADGEPTFIHERWAIVGHHTAYGDTFAEVVGSVLDAAREEAASDDE